MFWLTLKDLICPISTIESAKAAAKKSGGSFEIIHDMESAFKDADIIYPKSWGPWMTTTDDDEAKELIAKYEALDHRRTQDGSRQRRCDLHAPAAC